VFPRDRLSSFFWLIILLAEISSRNTAGEYRALKVQKPIGAAQEEAQIPSKRSFPAGIKTSSRFQGTDQAAG
jgi:hypothetical protein